MIDLPPPTYEQTIEAVVRCDIPRANIAIKYEDYLQSDEVSISDLGLLSDDKLRCLKAAVHPFYILTIANQAQQAAFFEFSRREDRPREKVDATDWLRQKGLLSRLPTFEPGDDLQQFAGRLETACGLERGKGLIVLDPQTLTTAPGIVQTSDFERSGERLYCLVQMFAATDATERGIRFVFIGNEASAEEER